MLSMSFKFNLSTTSIVDLGYHYQLIYQIYGLFFEFIPSFIFKTIAEIKIDDDFSSLS